MPEISRCEVHGNKLEELEEKYEDLKSAIGELIIEIKVMRSKIENGSFSFNESFSRIYNRVDEYFSTMNKEISTIRKEIADLKSDFASKFVAKSDLNLIIFIVSAVIGFLTFLINYFLKR